MVVSLHFESNTFYSQKHTIKMKKTLSFALVAAAMLIAGKANAQLNVHVGYAPQTYTATVGNSDDKMELNGFFIGADFNLPISGDLKVDLGANLRYNTKEESNGTSILGVPISGKVTNTQMLLDIPILLNYGLELKRDVRISAFVGPTITYALSGTTKSEGSLGALSASDEYDWYGDNSGRSRFDIAATFGLSVDFRDFRLFGGYNLGLLDLAENENITIKGNNWFVGFGYNL